MVLRHGRKPRSGALSLREASNLTAPVLAATEAPSPNPTEGQESPPPGEEEEEQVGGCPDRARSFADEMEAAGPCAKRRRSDAPEIGEAEVPPAAAAADPPGGEQEDQEDGVDRISGLPDAVLEEIISLLPTKDGARTQTLASRWRHLWRSAPLNLDYGDLPADTSALRDLVTRIVSAHQGPGRRLRISAVHLRNFPDVVDAWLRSPALDNLQELDFCNAQPSLVEPPPPDSTFRFSSSLVLLTMGNCSLTDATPQELHFPQLKHLTLDNVSVSENSLHSLIDGCPSLVSLLLNYCVGFTVARINSPNLRSIGWRANIYSGEREIIIENAPCLQRLINLQYDLNLNISVISAPKLHTVGYLSNWYDVCRIAFGNTIFKRMRFDSLVTVMHSVKILAVDLRFLCLDAIIDLLRCFPSLEKLYMKSCRSAWPNSWRRKHGNFIKCFDICLRTIVMENYKGIQSQVHFLTFFVLNAKVLELMRLEIKDRCDIDSFIEEQHRLLLQLEKRASRGAQFSFTTDRCMQNILNFNQARDLALADDPFVCEF